MRVLITGGRGFTDREMLYGVLDLLHAQHGFTLLIHGDADGADRMGGEWATERGVEPKACPANWKRYRRAAGPIRNRAMLKEDPEMLVAFPGGNGTRDMVQVVKDAGLPTILAEEIWT